MSTLLNVILNSQDGITLNTEGKYCDKNILIKPQLEDKTVAPTTEQQIITVSDGYAGIRQVTVEKTPITQPQLLAPTISLVDSTLTIAPNTGNGIFVKSYDLYDNDTLLGNYTVTVIDISTLGLESTYHSLTIKAKGENFRDSEASNAVVYPAFVTEENEYGTTVVLNSYVEETNDYGTTVITQ